VCELRGYMPNVDGKDEDKPTGRIAILEDTNGDGTADKRTTFLEETSFLARSPLLPAASFLPISKISTL
ncbi:MAG: hypothetical protein ACK56K_08640, partial [Akkermansiaceae bacterium]